MNIKKYGSECNLCSLCKNASFRCVDDYNTDRIVDILLVLPYMPFSTNSQKMINHPYMKRILGLIKEAHPDKSVGITSIIKCATRDKAKGEHTKTCTENYLFAIFRRMRPKVIITMGAKAASVFTNEKNFFGGDVYQSRFGRCLFTQDLSAIEDDYNFDFKFTEDIQWLFKDKEKFDKSKFTIDIPKTIHEIELIEDELLSDGILFTDIEGSTTPFHPKPCGYKVMCASFTIRRDHAYVIPLRTAIPMYANEAITLRAEEAVKRIYQHNNTKVGHNFKYDSLFLNIVYDIVMRGFKYDTILMKYLIDERPPHNLKDLCSLNIPKLKEYDKELADYISKHPECDPKKDGSYFYIPNPILVPYNGLDTIATYEIFHHFFNKVFSNEQWKYLYHNIMIPVTKAYMQIEYNGAGLNKSELIAYGGKLQQMINKFNIDMATHLVNNGISAKINMNSPEQIAQVLIKLGEVKAEDLKVNAKGSYTCDDKVITKLLNQGSHLAYLVNGLKKSTKEKGTYVDGFLKKCDTESRVHGSFSIFFTDTGRSSCTDPNMQNIPSKLRRFIIPDKGHILIERDFSQLELRLMASRTADPVMLEIYKRNEDIHKMTAASSELIVKHPKEFIDIIDKGDVGAIIKYIMDYYKSLDKGYAKKLRQKAKAPNFHFIYGGYYKTLAKRINTDNEKMIKGIKLLMREEKQPDMIANYEAQIKNLMDSMISEDEAKQFEDAFFALYREIKTYHIEVDEFVKKHGYVTSPLGRVKHLPDAMCDESEYGARMRIIDACNAAKNHWIQSAGGDLKYETLILLQKELNKRGMATRLINEVHDSIIAEVPYDEISAYYDLSAECMDNWDKKYKWILCKIPSDAKICINNWATGVEVANKEELKKLLADNKISIA